MNEITSHFAYLLRCSDGSYYAGYTNDLQRRLTAHLGGTASKYTRARLPVQMVYWQSFSSKSEAMSEEARLKRLRHKQKAGLAVAFGKVLVLPLCHPEQSDGSRPPI